VESPPTFERNSLLCGLALVVLAASGIVLALSWAVPFPDVVLNVAWLVAFIAMTAVFGFAFRHSRISGSGFGTALADSFKALGKFIYAFF
jgi:hypothetical protein